jgi:uncharacterized protein (TIGR03086 family)
MDVLDLYQRATEWSASKIPAAAAKLDASTPCDKWDVRAVLNHMLDSQQWFADVPQGTSTPGPSPTPPDLITDDPVKDYQAATEKTLAAYQDASVTKEHGPTLGIGFVDQLVHGWDLATATGQDAAMPADLAETAFNMVNGRMDGDKRGEMFKPEVKVGDDASAQEKLLAYSGRDPAG